MDVDVASDAAQDRGDNESNIGESSPKTPITTPRLGTCDHPGLILSTPLLTADNYRAWRESLIRCLVAKGKICFVTGELPMPEK